MRLLILTLTILGLLAQSLKMANAYVSVPVREAMDRLDAKLDKVMQMYTQYMEATEKRIGNIEAKSGLQEETNLRVAQLSKDWPGFERRMDQAMTGIQHASTNLEARIAQIETRLAANDNSLAELRQRAVIQDRVEQFIRETAEKQDRQSDKAANNQRWLIGLLGSSFIAIMGIAAKLLWS